MATPDPSMPEYALPDAQTSTMAIVSLVSGIVSWFALPIIGGIVAVVTGHLAKNEIRQSAGELTGEGMATAGLVLGYLHLGLVIIGGVCVLLALLAFGVTLPFFCIPFGNQFSQLFAPLLGF